MDLGCTKVSDFSCLKKLTKFETLVLNGDGISDISFVKNMTNLTKLILQGNNISDLAPLKKLTSLKTLYLPAETLTEEDVAPLREALPNCEIILQKEL